MKRRDLLYFAFDKDRIYFAVMSNVVTRVSSYSCDNFCPNTYRIEIFLFVMLITVHTNGFVPFLVLLPFEGDGHPIGNEHAKIAMWDEFVI